MQKMNRKRIAANLTLLTLGITLCANMATAQGQGRRGGGGQNGQGRSAMGQGMRPMNGQNAMGGQMSAMGQGGMGQGSGSRQMPGLRGTILAGDINTGQILIEGFMDGAQYVVQVTNETQIFTTSAAQSGTTETPPAPPTTQTQAQGRMRGNAQSGGMMGQRSAQFQGNGGMRRGGGGQGGGQRGMQGSMNQSSASGNSSMVSNSPEMNLQQIAFNDLKVGDRMVAMGQRNSDGVFVASRIFVNMDQRGGGQGGQQQGGQGMQCPPQDGTTQNTATGQTAMSRSAQRGGTGTTRATGGMRQGGRPRN